MKFKRFIVTERDKNLVYKHLPNTKDVLIKALVEEGWSEKSFVRTLIWYMKCQGDIYTADGIIQRV